MDSPTEELAPSPATYVPEPFEGLPPIFGADAPPPRGWRHRPARANRRPKHGVGEVARVADAAAPPGPTPVAPAAPRPERSAPSVEERVRAAVADLLPPPPAPEPVVRAEPTPPKPVAVVEPPAPVVGVEPAPAPPPAPRPVVAAPPHVARKPPARAPLAPPPSSATRPPATAPPATPPPATAPPATAPPAIPPPAAALRPAAKAAVSAAPQPVLPPLPALPLPELPTYDPEPYDPKTAGAVLPAADILQLYGTVLRKRRGHGAVITLVVLLAILVAAGLFAWRQIQHSGHHGGPVTYTSAAGRFSASFPTAPEEGGSTHRAGGFRTTTRLVVDVPDHMLVGSARITPAVPARMQKGVFAGLAQEMAKDNTLILAHHQRTTFRGHPALAGEFWTADGSPISFLVTMYSARQVYMIFAPSGPPFTKLEASFVPLS